MVYLTSFISNKLITQSTIYRNTLATLRFKQRNSNICSL